MLNRHWAVNVFENCPSLATLLTISPLPWNRPGDYLKPGEDEIEGLKRRLDDRLAPPPNSQFDQATHGLNNDWEIGDCLAQWWRPNFETFMVSLPYFSFLSYNDLHIFKPVSFHTRAYYETQGVQKTLRCSDARKK